MLPCEIDALNRKDNKERERHTRVVKYFFQKTSVVEFCGELQAVPVGSCIQLQTQQLPLMSSLIVEGGFRVHKFL